MRTTISIQDNLLERAQQQVIRENCMLGDFYHAALALEQGFLDRGFAQFTHLGWRAGIGIAVATSDMI